VRAAALAAFTELAQCGAMPLSHVLVVCDAAAERLLDVHDRAAAAEEAFAAECRVRGLVTGAALYAELDEYNSAGRRAAAAPLAAPPVPATATKTDYQRRPRRRGRSPTPSRPMGGTCRLLHPLLGRRRPSPMGGLKERPPS
jgi:hypothetical protein